MFVRPPFRLESLPLERLLFPPACQQRAGLPLPASMSADLRAACCRPDATGELVAVADPAAVAQLVAALEEGEQFDPLEVVREQPKKPGQPLYHVFGGFTRGAAYLRHGKLSSVPCHVYEGTLQDAIFYSLSENYRNVQTRGHGSARKAVEVLIGSASLMERVREEARRKQCRLDEAIMLACRVSRATVKRVLEDAALSIEGMRIVPRKPRSSDTANLGSVSQDSSVRASELQVAGPVSQPLNDQPGEAEPEEPEPEGGEEPAYTVPADLAWVPEEPVAEGEPTITAQPDAVVGGVSVEAKPGEWLAADRATFDQAIRCLKEAQELFARLLARRGGSLLERVTVGGNPLFTRRLVKVSPTVSREGWVSRELATVLHAARRVRPKLLCAACHGAPGGCRACRGSGFVPDDESLLANPDAQLPFDFGSPWEWEGGEA